MTRVEQERCGFKILFWTDGGMQNGYHIQRVVDDATTYLFCDHEGAEYIEHLMQLGDGDFRAEAESNMFHAT